MGINEITGIQAKHAAILAAAGLTTAAAVRAAGMAGLVAIAGIGDKTAAALLAALPEPDEDPAVVMPDPPLSPLRWVIVRNAGTGPVVVGNEYLYPGEARKVRAAHAPAGLSIKEISTDGH